MSRLNNPDPKSIICTTRVGVDKLCGATVLLEEDGTGRCWMCGTLHTEGFTFAPTEKGNLFVKPVVTPEEEESRRIALDSVIRTTPCFCMATITLDHVDQGKCNECGLVYYPNPV